MKSTIQNIFILIIGLINFDISTQAQSIDPNFKPKIATRGTINAINTYLNGSYIVAGDFNNVYNFRKDTFATKNIVKCISNGEIDEAFSQNIGSGANAQIRTMQIDEARGKIYIAGDFAFFNGRTVNRFVCLNTDGTIDENFQAKIGDGFARPVNVIELQPDGKILIAGNFEVFNNIRVNRMIRLFPNGDLDMGFIQKTTTIPIMNNQINTLKYHKGKILVGGNFTNFFGVNRIARFDTTGAIDAAFSNKNGNGFNRLVTSINVQEDDKILVCGQFTTFFANNNTARFLVKLNWAGGQDNTFHIDPSNFVLSTLPLSNKRQLLGGDFRTINGDSSRFMAIVDSLGNLDKVFAKKVDTLIRNTVNTIVKLPENDSLYIFGGAFDQLKGIRASVGAIDQTGEIHIEGKFNNIFTTRNMRIVTILEQPNRKLLVSGEIGYVDGYEVNRIFRLFPNGHLDTAFVKNVGKGPNNDIFDLKIQYPDSLNSIIAVGDIVTFDEKFVGRVIRLDSNGVLDSTFVANHTDGNSTDNTVNSVVVQRDGRGIIAAGEFTKFFNLDYNRLIKLDGDGKLVSVNQFRANKVNNGINSEIKSISELSDGTVVAVGTFTSFYDNQVGRIVRFDNNGVLVSNFIATGGDLAIDKAFVQENDKIILAGNFEVFNGVEKYRVARINKNGGLDNDFKFKLTAGNNDFVNNIAFQKIGGEEKIVVGGRFSDFSGNKRFLQRLNNDGSLDDSFEPNISLTTDAKVFKVKNDQNPELNDIIITADIPGSMIRLTTPAQPLKPENLTASVSTINNLQVDLKWLYRKGAVFFQLQRSRNAFFGYENVYTSPLIPTIDRDTLITYSFADRNILNNVQYFYRVRAVNRGNASVYSNVVGIILSDLITAKESELAQKIKLYPNPTSKNVSLDFSGLMPIFDTNTTIEIINHQGQLINSFQANLLINNELDISYLHNGLYILRIRLANRLIHKKLLKH